MGFAPTTWKQINPLDRSEDDGDDDEPRRVEEFMSPIIGTAMRCAIWLRSRAYMIGSTPVRIRPSSSLDENGQLLTIIPARPLR
jgi:hypothetical protein